MEHEYPDLDLDVLSDYPDRVKLIRPHGKESHHGVTFFRKKKTEKNYTIWEFLNKNMTDDDIMVKKTMWNFGWVSIKKFLEMIKYRKFSNKKLYEVIATDRPRRAYFDVDGKKECVLYNTITVIREIFGENVKMTISGSVGMIDGKKKWSYHIVLPEIIFNNYTHMIKSNFVEWIKVISLGEGCEDNPLYNGIDTAVYKKNFSMKTIYQGKEKDKRRQQIYDLKSNTFVQPEDVEGSSHNIKDHIINVLPNTKTSPIDDDILHKLETYNYSHPAHQKKLRQNINMKSVKNPNNKLISFVPPILEVKENLMDFNLMTDKQLLFKIPNIDEDKYRLPFEVHKKIAVWSAKSNEIIKEDFIAWEATYTGDKKEFMGKHFDDFKNPTYRPIYRKTLIYWLECWYGRVKKNPTIINMKKQFYSKEDASANEIVRPTEDNPKCYLKASIFNSGKKATCILAVMGGGKTYITIYYLYNLWKANPNIRILWLVNNICFSLNLFERLFIDEDTGEKRDWDFKNYKKLKGSLKAHNLLVCSIQSLYRTSYIKEYQYDVLVMDEIESFYKVFKTDTCHKIKTANGIIDNYDRNYIAFENHIRLSKQIFAMDAFLHKRTLKYLNIVDKNMTTHLVMRDKSKDKMNKTLIVSNDWEIMNMIEKDLKDGKNVYLFYPYKSRKGNTFKGCEMIKEYLMTKIPELNKKNICVLTGDSSKKEKDTLKNVDKEWKVLRLLILNSCVTVGVNFTKLHFDKCYMMYSDFLEPRDVVQASMRIREFKENDKMYVALLKNSIKAGIYKNLEKKKKENEALNSDDDYDELTINNKLMIVPKFERWEDLSNNGNGLKEVRKIIDEEHFASNFEMLLYFFQSAGCKIEYSKLLTKEDTIEKLKMAFKSVVEVIDDPAKYENVRSICPIEYLKYKNKIEEDLTPVEQLEMYKFYIDKKCVEVTDFNKFLFETPKFKDGLDDLKSLHVPHPKSLLRYALKYVSGEDEYKIVNQDKFDLSERITYNTDVLSNAERMEIFIYLKIGFSVKEFSKWNKKNDYIIKKSIVNVIFGTDKILNCETNDKIGNKKYKGLPMRHILRSVLRLYRPFCRNNIDILTEEEKTEKRLQAELMQGRCLIEDEKEEIDLSWMDYDKEVETVEVEEISSKSIADEIINDILDYSFEIAYNRAANSENWKKMWGGQPNLIFKPIRNTSHKYLFKQTKKTKKYTQTELKFNKIQN
jgi:hypothetical protein